MDKDSDIDETLHTPDSDDQYTLDSESDHEDTIKNANRGNVNVIVGTHINSNVNKMEKTLEVLSPGINMVQFFVEPSNDYKSYQRIGNILKEKNIKSVIHSAYTINIADEWDSHSWWVQYLVFEIKMAQLLGSLGIVIHTGKKLEINKQVAMNNMYSLLLHIDSATKKQSDVKIIIETASGQGSEMLWNIDELMEFMKKFKDNNRFGVCLDTCHVFAAGYDIKKKKVFTSVINKITGAIGEDKLMLVHLNDSKNDVGEKLDRHESLGYGFIGRKGLGHIIKKIKNMNIPIILETPFTEHESEVNWIINI